MSPGPEPQRRPSDQQRQMGPDVFPICVLSLLAWGLDEGGRHIAEERAKLLILPSYLVHGNFIASKV